MRLLDIEREGSEYQDYPEQDFSVEYRDSSHRYWLLQGEERIPMTSVTAALAVLDKPALRRWQGNEDAAAVLELERSNAPVVKIEPDETTRTLYMRSMPPEKAAWLAREARMGAEAKRDAGADRGKAVHRALQVYCQTGAAPPLSDFDPEHRGFVQGVAGWLLEAAPEPLLVEQIVASPEHKIAGRFDLLAEINGITALVDLKTSAKVWPEHHLQLAGYQIALESCGIQPPSYALILAAAEDGTFQTAICQADAAHFLAVLGAYRAMSTVRAAVKAAA